MCLLNLVEQHDGIRVATNSLGQLATIFIANISRRGPDQTRDVETLCIFAHVDADQGVGRTKHVLCQLLGQISLSHAGRPQEHERPDGMVGLFQPHPVALYGFHHFLDGRILSNDVTLQFGGHADQPYAFRLRHTLNGDSRHHGDDIGHIVGRNLLQVVVVSSQPLLIQQPQFCFYLRLTIPIAGCQFKVLVPDSQVLLLLHLFYFLFLSLDVGRQCRVLQMQSCPHLVHCVYGLVGEIAVGDVSFCQFGTSFQCLIIISDMVMLFVPFLDVVEYLDCLAERCRLDQHFLETPFEGPILFNAVSILVKRSRSYTLYGAAGQRRLHNVGRVHAPRGASRSYQGVDFVDEDNDVRVLFKLFEQRPNPFLKLSSVLGAGHDSRHVQRHDAPVE